MNTKEEISVVESAKQALINNKTTIQEIREQLTGFMNLYEPNTRKFPIITEYLKTL